MKTFTRFTIALLLIMTPLAFAGSSAGNGTGVHDEFYYHPWFTGPLRTITYCATISPEFGVSLETARHEAETAFQMWTEYRALKHLHGVDLATQLVYQEKCDGKQDLAIYFGTHDAVIDGLMKNYDQPIGFSERTAFDVQAKWGKGVMWLSNPRTFQTWYKLDWNSPALRAILLHEWGHILGNRHVPQTIMDAELGYRVIQSGGPGGGALNLPVDTIDSRFRELFPCYDCRYEVDANNGPDLEAGFKRLVGRAPVGSYGAHLQLQEARGDEKNGKLVLMDQLGSAELSLHTTKLIAWRNADITGDNGGATSGVWFGTLTDAHGKATRIALNRNLLQIIELVDLDAPVPTDSEDRSRFFSSATTRVMR